MLVKERLQNSDKQAEIELYYELLSSGHSVGEILNAVGPMQSKSKRGDSAVLEQPQSEPDGVTNVVFKAALVNAAEAKLLSTSGLHRAHEAERCNTGEPLDTEDRWLDETGSDYKEQILSENMAGSKPDIVKAAGADTSIIHEREIDSSDPERLRLDKFPNNTRRVAVLAFYTLAVSFLSIAGFSVTHPSRDAEPTNASTLSDVPNQTRAIAIPRPVAAHSEAAVEFLIPRKPVSALPQRIEAGAQETVPETQREVEVAPQSAANRLGTTPRLADPATAPHNPEHEPATVVVEFPSTTPTGSVETAVHSDTGHSDTREPPEVRPKNGAKGTTAVPTGIGSAALPLGAHATKRHKASTSRQYAEARRRIRRPASVYYGLSRGSYYGSFDRGYSYGGPAPHSDAGG